MYRGSRRKEATLTATALAVSPDCRFCIPAPESHHGVAALASFRKVVARSYPNRTAIQFSKVTRETSPHRFGKGSGFAPPVRKKSFHLFGLGEVFLTPSEMNFFEPPHLFRLGRIKTNPLEERFFKKFSHLFGQRVLKWTPIFAPVRKIPPLVPTGRAHFPTLLTKYFCLLLIRTGKGSTTSHFWKISLIMSGQRTALFKSACKCFSEFGQKNRASDVTRTLSRGSIAHNRKKLWNITDCLENRKNLWYTINGFL